MRIEISSALILMLLISTVSGFCSSDTNKAKYSNDATRIITIPRLAAGMTTNGAMQDSQEIRRRRKIGAPLVDSALLRFVSAQKKQQEKIIKELERLKWSPAPSSSSTVTETLANRNDSTIREEDAVMTLIRSNDELDPWAGQYNRNRIAQKLVSLGADETLALKAGEKVQSYALVRTARRRIRLFLRERDSIWSQQGDALVSSQQLMENSFFRVKMPHPSYGFDDVVEVLLEFGLTGKDVCAILSHSPSLALMMPRESFAEKDATSDLVGTSSGETLEQTLLRSFKGLLLNTLGLRKYDARKVLRDCPGLLSVRGSKSALQIVAMMTKLGVSTSSIARDKRALPILLSRSPAGMFRLISFLSSDTIRIPLESIGPLLRRKHSRELLDAVVPIPRLQKPDETDDTVDEGLDPNIEAALWGKNREERTKRINDVYRNMTTTAWALKNEIGTRDLGKAVSAFPSVLLLNAEEEVLPTASFLMDDLGIMEGDLPRVLQLYPTLLSRDMDEMEQTASYLLSIGVKSEDLGSMFRAFPVLLTLDIQKDMEPVVDYLRAIGVINIGAFVTRLPTILGYSVEKEIKPKWEFLKMACMRADFEINKFPAYFSYPFERVIKARYDYLAAKGIARQLVPVDAVVRYGDIDFATRVARDDDGGKVFLKFCERRIAQSGPKKRRRHKSTKRVQKNLS